jgi:hypothetical protein
MNRAIALLVFECMRRSMKRYALVPTLMTDVTKPLDPGAVQRQTTSFCQAQSNMNERSY